MMAIIPKITLHKLPENQYVPTETPKSQIYLHHTASSPDPYGVFKWWAMTSERVSTAFVIAGQARTGFSSWRDGEIVQTFGSKYAGWHLGLKAKHLVKGGKSSTWLNLNTIGIEICNWGYLTETSKGFTAYTGAVIPKSEVCEYSTAFRGFKFYQKYTPTQLEQTRQLLIFLCDRYGIDPKFKGMEIFDIDQRALMGENGIWTHVSVRPDKFDCHPQKELIEMLQSL